MAFDQQGRQGDQTVSQGRTSVYGTRQAGQSQGASQYTRQYQTHQPYGRVQAQSGQASQDADEPQKRGVLSEFSGSAVIASALAAVTSFALQSKIGLAGSIIGVGVAAAATTIASQVYKGMLNASAQKLKDLSDQAPTTNGAYGATRDLRASSGTTQAWAKPVSLDDAASEAGMADSGTPIAPVEVRAAARAAEHRSQRRRATAVAAVVSIAAVLVFALAVGFVTKGKGIGTRPSAPAAQEQPQADGQAQTTVAESEGKGDERTDAKKDTTKKDAKKDDASGSASSASEGSGQQKADSAQGAAGEGDSAGQGTGASGGAGSGTAAGGTSSGAGNTSSSEGGGAATGGNTSSSTGAGTTADGAAGAGADSATAK